MVLSDLKYICRKCKLELPYSVRECPFCGHKKFIVMPVVITKKGA